jgi:hypothetical protein
MAIEKKSLISTLKTTKKANVAASDVKPSAVGATKTTSLRMKNTTALRKKGTASFRMRVG